jgi:peroxiredoxin
MKSFIFSTFFFISIIRLFSPADLAAQKAYKIVIEIDGLSDSLILLAGYNGDKQFVIDTALINKKNSYLFSGNEKLPEGMYIIAGSNKNRLFDFMVSGNQEFTITGNMQRLPNSLNARNSRDNQLLFDYIRFLSDKQKQQASIRDFQKKFAPGSDSASLAANQLDQLNQEVKSYISEIIGKHQGSFISVFLRAMQEPEVPSAPALPNGRPDSTFSYRYYKSHFWDNIDLSDARIIRTPFIHSKVEQYLNKLTVPAPDSLIVAIDELFRRIKTSEDAFKYLIWYLTVKYESSEIMGYDAVFVHLVDTYYQDQRMGWMNPTVKENLIKRASALKPVLIGKTAPEMILLDTLQNPVSLHRIPADYTIIYFWDPDCSHCKKESPLLRDFYLKSSNELNFEVYAVCMDTSWSEMKQYIRKNQLPWINVNGFYSVTPDFRTRYDVHASPVFFVLDREKRIIAKRILTPQIEAFLNQHSGRKQNQFSQ